MAQLVTDLLTLARMESAEGLLEVGDLDLRETLRVSERHYRAEAESRGVAVAADVPAEAVRVEGDAEALALLANNLLDNALKYTPAGGKVWLRLRTEGEWAVLEVQDTGIGIARDHHDRVFERFYRVDKARSRELGGTGLGLSIVKHICKAHGGRVTLDSVPGTGSTFLVFLPLRPDGI
jgi:two-component system phosphate regulon sensor histidine kinase PhoR